MNNSLGNFGSAVTGTNWGVESAATNQMALFQQLFAQQNGVGGGDNMSSSQGLTQTGDVNINTLSGNKRISESSDEDGGSVKKQQTAAL